VGDAALVHDRLRAFLAGQPDGGGGEITGLRRAGAGRSRDNWLFDLATERSDEAGDERGDERSQRGGPHREELILRSDPAGGLVHTDRRLEFAVLVALEKSGLPTPVPRWLDADGSGFGRPSLIMRRLPGDCDYRILADNGRTLAERRTLAEGFCDLLARVHQVDWQALGLGEVLHDPGPGAAAHELDRWESILRHDQLEPLPELDFAISVLRESAPRSTGTVLVHADFKPGNLLLDGDRVTALLDWELAHLGDPLEDLGWVTQPLRAGEHAVPGAWSAADLVAHYVQATGSEVDPRNLAWWVTFSTFKTAVMQVSGLRSFLEGRSDEPYRPTRRVLRTLLAAVTEGGAT
jgi:aminoglycoside phosphotransferase (APT) family kinase protein